MECPASAGKDPGCCDIKDIEHGCDMENVEQTCNMEHGKLCFNAKMNCLKSDIALVRNKINYSQPQDRRHSVSLQIYGLNSFDPNSVSRSSLSTAFNTDVSSHHSSVFLLNSSFLI